MKTTAFSCLLSLSFLVLGLKTEAAPPTPDLTKPAALDDKAVYRLWHDVQGRTVEATFRGIEGDNVYIQTKDGYVHRLPLNRLVPEDLALAKKLKPEGLGIPADPNVAKAAQKIDEIVALGLKTAKQEPNALASDEQFVRRVYLDLVGRVPTREETMAFLADTSSSKRAKVIDKLVSSDGFNSRMFDYFSDMLRMTDDAQKAKFFTYEEWFKDQLRQNRPWDKIVYDMMTADGKLLENGASGYLLRDKGMRLDNLSLTLSTFLGANVSCAQCHDHPFADWTQRQFYEMAAFFGETDTYKGKGSKNAYGNMRKELTPEELKRAKKLFLANALAVTDGNTNEVKLPDDYKYKDGKPGDPISPKLVMWSAEDKKLPIYAMADTALKNGSGKEDLRETFAKWMTSPQNPRFSITIANRLWKLVFGVAAKEPVTDLDTIADSPNPVLLTHLGEEMKRLNFDIRAFMRLLCNTQTYQREAITKEINPGEPYYFPGPVLRRMTSEQAWDSCVTLAIGDKVDDYKIKRAEAYASVMNLSGQVTADEVRSKLGEMGKVASKNAGVGKPQNAKNNKRRMMMTNNEVEDLDHTRPSVMDGLVLARASELQQPEKEQHFLRMFGQSDRQISDSNSDEGSIPQVLMLMNGEAQSVLRNPLSLVLSTSINMKTPAQQVESLYYSFFSRKPTPSELTEATQALSSGLTVSDLTWVLFNTREFVFVQ
ncbi:DUF1549 and DUF1553 domain-containing protein [soil metagenome]